MFGLPSLSSTLVLALSLGTLAAAGNHEAPRRRHVGTNYLERNQTLTKRFDNARFSYYEAGQGACGAWNNDNDFIVALNSAQFDGGKHCFNTITISYNGKSTQAKIADECPGCPYGGLDLTPGLFSYFASKDAGIIYGQWDFGEGAKPAPEPKPTTEKPPPPPPTTTSHTPKPTPTPEPSPSPVKEHVVSSSSAPPSSSSTSSKPSSSSVASSTAESSAASSSATPVPTSTTGIGSTNGALLQMIAMIAAAEQSGSNSQ